MADPQDKDAHGQSEYPTQRRLEKAREQGNVPQSKELYHVALLGASLLFFYWQGRTVCYGLFCALKGWIVHAGTHPADGYALRQALSHLFHTVWMYFLGYALGLVAVIALVVFFQSRWRINPKFLHISWEKVSPLKGIKRLFSQNNVVDFLKNLLKISVLFLIIFLSNRALMQKVGGLSGICVRGILDEIMKMVEHFVFLALGVLLLLALSDYGYQWFRWIRQLFMSKKDIQDEQKEAEKSTLVASKQRQVRKEMLAMRNARVAVPDATVVVMNPTHYAVALKWVPHQMMAPEVIAKGADQVALYIRNLAEKHSIPVVENQSLARSLFKDTAIGQAINPRHYKAVAEVIHYVMTLKENLRKKG
ncbi:EscU/YscU/HrcU family type III secretion system export apparatus switch protein [bacterium NHP-B]|nr:EscU/YscU/HrcU family type III secretion system export apparatus switch protein [bacterium NHP-B]